jgi:hypothetical protein
MEEGYPKSQLSLSGGRESAHEVTESNENVNAEEDRVAAVARKVLEGQQSTDAGEDQEMSSQVQYCNKSTETARMEDNREHELADPQDDQERQLDDDMELHLVRRMRLAFEASLQMLEAVRDDLVEMGDRMDRLSRASQLCREALRKKKERRGDGES